MRYLVRMTIAITTLKTRADFLRLRNGRKYNAPTFILRVGPSDIAGQKGARVGYTVTTKCGNSVVRNRIKRRLRALVREIFPEQARAGQDYIFIARHEAKPGAGEVAMADLRASLLVAMAALNRA